MAEYMCNQKNCDAEATYRYTWPGKDEAGICELHALKVRSIASAIGMHIQLLPLEETND